ncbi:Glucosamine-6-phosphate deaminase 1 [Novipirellula galeiformis]|uniref:Glucosamine-6-phosphate deaminase n=1 Tax=Novipirellula galeiformis TaxID=2528004 RepID=A0A5C6CRK6_9BACT|nr:glucosamine-6-phosphate deaminase [Novipirellula galeiformis]TWU26167.1 Glucosamine-6-phosphate deaminase 1 [Novipirellula galeiformis]
MSNPVSQSSNTSSPQVIVCADEASASRKVADMIVAAVNAKPSVVLGLATGGTPVKTYANIVEDFRAGKVDFRNVTSFNLDEYIGLSGTHPQSFRHFMELQLFNHINIDPSKTFVPEGCGDDPAAHAAEFEKRIADAGGIDLQLLGIGHNGHIAFNEPGSSADSRTRVVGLTQSTIEKNARFFDSEDEVPKTAITMGIGTILEAKQIVLLATGTGKAEAIRLSLQASPSDDVPASWLAKHPQVTFVLDEAAASELA